MRASDERSRVAATHARQLAYGLSPRRLPLQNGEARFVNGEKVGQGRIEVTQCCAFSATEGADVGLNTGTPVSPDYTNPFKFNGTIEKVTIDLKEDKTRAADKEAIEQQRNESDLKRAVSN
jgi:hypothetical protein